MAKRVTYIDRTPVKDKDGNITGYKETSRKTYTTDRRFIISAEGKTRRKNKQELIERRYAGLPKSKEEATARRLAQQQAQSEIQTATAEVNLQAQRQQQQKVIQATQQQTEQSRLMNINGRIDATPKPKTISERLGRWVSDLENKELKRASREQSTFLESPAIAVGTGIGVITNLLDKNPKRSLEILSGSDVYNPKTQAGRVTGLIAFNVIPDGFLNVGFKGTRIASEFSDIAQAVKSGSRTGSGFKLPDLSISGKSGKARATPSRLNMRRAKFEVSQQGTTGSRTRGTGQRTQLRNIGTGFAKSGKEQKFLLKVPQIKNPQQSAIPKLTTADILKDAERIKASSRTPELAKASNNNIVNVFKNYERKEKALRGVGQLDIDTLNVIAKKTQRVFRKEGITISRKDVIKAMKQKASNIKVGSPKTDYTIKTTKVNARTSNLGKITGTTTQKPQKALLGGDGIQKAITKIKSTKKSVVNNKITSGTTIKTGKKSSQVRPPKNIRPSTTAELGEPVKDFTKYAQETPIKTNVVDTGGTYSGRVLEPSVTPVNAGKSVTLEATPKFGLDRDRVIQAGRIGSMALKTIQLTEATEEQTTPIQTQRPIQIQDTQRTIIPDSTSFDASDLVKITQIENVRPNYTDTPNKKTSGTNPIPINLPVPNPTPKIPRLPNPTPFIRSLPKTPSLPKINLGLNKGGTKKSFFTAYARVGGQWRKVGSSDNPIRAFEIGKGFVFRTSSASFKVLDSSGIKKKGFSLGGMLRTSKKDKGVFVEKRKFRLDAGKELSQITFKPRNPLKKFLGGKL